MAVLARVCWGEDWIWDWQRELGVGRGPPFLDRPSSGESSAGHSRRGGPPTALTARLHPFEFCRVCKENKGGIWALGFPLSFIWADPGTEGLHLQEGVGPLGGEAWLVLATEDAVGQWELDLGVL